MATTTLEAARQAFAARYGLSTPEAVEWTTTTAPTGSAATVISTDLVAAGYGRDDYFGGAGVGSPTWFVYITGTGNTQVTRAINDYAGTSGTITVAGANVNTADTNVTFELHKVHPARIHNLLNEARLDAFPALHITKIDETVWTTSSRVTYEQPSSIIGRPSAIYLLKDIVPESFAENLLGDLTVSDWTGTQITLAAEAVTTNPTNYATWRNGSIKCTTDVSGAEGTALTSVSNPSNHDALRFSFGIWVYSLTASRIKARIKLNSTATDGSVAHSGTGWEYLTVQATLNTATLSTIDVGISVTTGTDFLFYMEEEGILTAGPMYHADADAVQLLNWDWEPRASGSSNADLIRFRSPLPDRHFLRIVGMGTLSSVSAETDTFEVAGPEINILYDTAAVKLFQELSNAPGADPAIVRSLGRAAGLLSESMKHRMYFPKSRVRIPDAV